uniref:Uncharacterized protein n=1 Tax=Rhizophora mucronata TaxID=61149 RepID=A0A2P2QCX2_RHIMU
MELVPTYHVEEKENSRLVAESSTVSHIGGGGGLSGFLIYMYLFFSFLL